MKLKVMLLKVVEKHYSVRNVSLHISGMYSNNAPGCAVPEMPTAFSAVSDLESATWHGGGPWFRTHCARWGPSSPPQKGGTAPNFRPMFVVAKRLDGSRCHLVGR